MNTDFDVAVIGAGVVGLAIGRHLAEQGVSVVVMERDSRFGQAASSRNSGCIHAGAYYHTGSLKASLCLRGRNLLYEFCQRYAVPHHRCGKLFIVTEDQYVGGLDRLKTQAEVNGVDGMVALDAAGIRAREPAVHAKAGLLCPHSGVIDVPVYMLTLLGLGEAAGMTLATHTRAVAAHPTGSLWQIRFEDGGGSDTVSVRTVVNAAGLWGLDLAREVFPTRDVPKPNPLKGGYVRFTGPAPVSTLIYPDLVPGVLNPRVDATPGMDGVLRFGPNVAPAQAYDDYREPDDLVDSLLPAIQRYLPAITRERLAPDFAGVRPRIVAPAPGPSDFLFDFAPIPGWLDLWGMESPGMTASLAVAEHVHSLLSGHDLV